MKKEEKNLYEGMYIISARLSDDAREKALEKITNSVVDKGGQIHKIHNLGKRRLAYDIAGHREGYYYVIYFSVIPSVISRLWKEHHLNEDLVRFLNLRADSVMEEIKFKPLVEVQ